METLELVSASFFLSFEIATCLLFFIGLTSHQVLNLFGSRLVSVVAPGFHSP